MSGRKCPHRKSTPLSLQLIQAGKGEALRIRAILRSLVPIEDLVGVISLPVQIPSFGKGKQSMVFGKLSEFLFRVKPFVKTSLMEASVAVI